MYDMKQDSRYEELYTQLLERGLDIHINNKKRIRAGLIMLVLLPVVLGIIRRLTGSNKIVFLIIWVFCMFALCIYLITIEYIDDSIQKTLEEVTDREAGFDDLLIGTEQIEERISERHDRIHERIQARHERRMERLRELKAQADRPADKPVDNKESGDEK